MTICSSIDMARWFGLAGDPTIIAWIVTVVYAIAGWTSHTAAVQAKRQRRSRANLLFWRAMLIAMILLGLNKQLDLQSLMLDCGRTLSREGGWFAYRRVAERSFAAVVAASLVLLLTLTILRMRSPRLDMIISISGIAALVCFILLRTGSILHVPGLDRTTTGSFQSMLELCGVVAVAFGGYRATARA